MSDIIDDLQPSETPKASHPSGRHSSRPVVQHGRLRLVAICAAVLIGVLAVAVVIDVAVTEGRVHPGVTVGDVSVGYMTPQKAREALAAAFAAGSKSPVTAVFEQKRWTVTGEQIGARVDATRSIESAMAVGRTGGVASMIAQRLSAVFGGESVPVLVAGDPERAAPLLDEIATAVTLPARDASVTVEGTSVGLIASRAGRILERERTLAAITTAFVTEDRTGSVVTEAVPVAVSDADARQALEDARKMVSGPVRITFQDKSTNIAAPQVARWIVITQAPVVEPAVELSTPATGSAETTGVGVYRRMTLVAAFDPARIGTTIASMTAGVGRPARDAEFVASGGTVRIKPSQVGSGPDLAGLAEDLALACVGAGEREATMGMAETQPRLTTAAARAMGVSNRISTYTTTYSSANRARVSNVHTLARAFDYKLVPPGGVFSFNKTAGQRTAAKGYQEAPAIVNGKLVPQLGGGVCQVGTTFFNTVFFAGLPIVERRNHSFYISHYPKGRDATVSWGGPDFKFKNDTEGWILIRTAYTNTSLTIALYGTDPGYRVKYTTSAFTGTTPHRVVELKDPKLAKGVRIIQDAGVDGRKCTVVRTVYSGATVVRTDSFVSNYRSKDEIVRVGTKAPSKPATGTASP